MSTWQRMMLILDGSRLWWFVVGFNVGMVAVVALYDLGVQL
jgi:hypothetical protein